MKAIIEIDIPNYQIGQEVSIYFKDTMMIKGVVQEPNNDTVSRGVFEQVMWERDIAIGQLKELGYGLGQKIEPCGDAISRQTVNEIINDIRDCISVEGYWAIIERMKKLPPVNPQPYEDAISRQAVQDYIAKFLSQYLYNDVREAIEAIDEYIGELPPVNPQEPKTGHWIKKDGYSDCSECGSHIVTEWDYCPKCGARMESEE